jgi:hypothetical protein
MTVTMRASNRLSTHVSKQIANVAYHSKSAYVHVDVLHAVQTVASM